MALHGHKGEIMTRPPGKRRRAAKSVKINTEVQRGETFNTTDIKDPILLEKHFFDTVVGALKKDDDDFKRHLVTKAAKKAAKIFAHLSGTTDEFIGHCYTLYIDGGFTLNQISKIVEDATATRFTRSWIQRMITSCSLRKKYPEENHAALTKFKDVEKDAILSRVTDSAKQSKLITEGLIPVNRNGQMQKTPLHEVTRSELSNHVKHLNVPQDSSEKSVSNDTTIESEIGVIAMRLSAIKKLVEARSEFEILVDPLKEFQAKVELLEAKYQ